MLTARLASMALAAAMLAWGAGAATAASPAYEPDMAAPFIDPEVRELVSQGPARVLVALRLPGHPPGTPPPPEAIAAKQQQVLARLTSTRATVVRRYTTVPLLALDIDAAALAELSAMTDLVARVLPDRMARPQQ